MKEYFDDKNKFEERVLAILAMKMKIHDVDAGGLGVVEFTKDGMRGYMIKGSFVLRTGYDDKGWFITDSLKGFNLVL